RRGDEGAHARPREGAALRRALLLGTLHRPVRLQPRSLPRARGPAAGGVTEMAIDQEEVSGESPFKGKTGLTRLVNAFFNSMAGLEDAFRHESAFRQEILLAVVTIPVACLVPVTPAERALLIASVVLVIIVELLNTGVEVAIDRISFDRHALSKRA